MAVDVHQPGLAEAVEIEVLAVADVRPQLPEPLDAGQSDVAEQARADEPVGRAGQEAGLRIEPFADLAVRRASRPVP